MSRNEEVSKAIKGDAAVTWIGRVNLKVAPAPLLATAHKLLVSRTIINEEAVAETGLLPNGPDAYCWGKIKKP